MKKTVFITGVTRGIGRATAILFAQKGYQVCGSYQKSQEAAQTLAAELEKIGANCRFFQGDAADGAAVRRIFQLTEAEFGGLDVLVANAGIAQQKLFSETTEEDWDRMMDVNAKGVFLACRYAMPLLRQSRGSIVTVSSIWGQVGASCEVIYSASKAAVIGLTKALAKEEGLSGIRVNCVCPGVIDTEMNQMLGADVLEELADETPLNRLGQAEEVAQAIYYLASPEASFVTGHIMNVNGGYVIN